VVPNIKNLRKRGAYFGNFLTHHYFRNKKISVVSTLAFTADYRKTTEIASNLILNFLSRQQNTPKSQTNNNLKSNTDKKKKKSQTT
jgi:hypothetical protein